MFDKEYYTIPRLPKKVKYWFSYVGSLFAYWMLGFSIPIAIFTIPFGWSIAVWWCIMLCGAIFLSIKLQRYFRRKYNV